MDLQLEYLRENHIEKVLLAVGYKANQIRNYVEHNNIGNVEIVEEFDLLGTGGALVNALSYISSDYALVVNGDTYFSKKIQMNF